MNAWSPAWADRQARSAAEPKDVVNHVVADVLPVSVQEPDQEAYRRPATPPFVPGLLLVPQLPKGKRDFDSPLAGRTIEMLFNGRKTYVLKMHMPGLQYRSCIYATLCGNPADSPLPSAPIPRRPAPHLAILERRA